MLIEQAKISDVTLLTELTIRSKDHWNYGQKQIEEWRDALTIKPAYIEEYEVYKLSEEDSIIGYYAYRLEDEDMIKLDSLFVEPKFIGKGYGKKLMIDFLNRVRGLNIRFIRLDSDPNAVEFYSQFGFTVIGKLETKVKNRFLPIMEIEMSS